MKCPIHKNHDVQLIPAHEIDGKFYANAVICDKILYHFDGEQCSNQGWRCRETHKEKSGRLVIGY